jgi:hypothetical protein
MNFEQLAPVSAIDAGLANRTTLYLSVYLGYDLPLEFVASNRFLER